MLKGAFLIAAAVAITAAFSFSVRSQTTIFNIPTADTLQQGIWNVEFDCVAKPVRYRDGGYQTLGYRVAYGVTNRTEVGANSYYTRDGTRLTADAEFSIKRKIYQNEKHAVTADGGAVAFVPLRSRGGDRTSVIVYAATGKTVSRLHGLTVTDGIYHFFGGPADFGDKTGGMFGIVQPINARFSFVADWLTGKNRFGYASAGFNWNITKRQYLLGGWSFGNEGRGNNALAVYYGLTF
jgi:hypothetical protein